MSKVSLYFLLAGLLLASAAQAGQQRIELTSLFQAATGDPGSEKAAATERPIPPEPSTIQQPFPWIETSPVPPLPPSLRRRQIEGEWDQAF